MKRLFKIALVAGGLLFAGSVANAQQKIAYINSAELIKAMPEVVNADKLLEVFKGSLDADGKTMYTEYQSKVTAFQTAERQFCDQGIHHDSKFSGRSAECVDYQTKKL